MNERLCRLIAVFAGPVTRHRPQAHAVHTLPQSTQVMRDSIVRPSIGPRQCLVAYCPVGNTPHRWYISSFFPAIILLRRVLLFLLSCVLGQQPLLLLLPSQQTELSLILSIPHQSITLSNQHGLLYLQASRCFRMSPARVLYTCSWQDCGLPT